MIQLYSLSLFLLGSVIGSFLNVVIYRLPKGESISYPPSHCSECDTRLKPLDLIPILSYLFLRGKCRTCATEISIQYPIVEAVAGFTFLFTYFRFGFTLDMMQYLFILSIFIAIFVIDYRHYIIPDSLNLLIFFIAVIFFGIGFIQGEHSVSDLLSRVYGLILGGGFFFLIAVVTGAMGGGDIKMMAALGFLFGLSSTLLLTFLSFVLGGILSGALLALKIKKRKDHIPFGPFICIAGVITIFWGEELIRWYMNTL